MKQNKLLNFLKELIILPGMIIVGVVMVVSFCIAEAYVKIKNKD